MILGGPEQSRGAASAWQTTTYPSNAHKTQTACGAAGGCHVATGAAAPSPPQQSGELYKWFQRDECKATRHSCKFIHLCRICGSWLHGAKFCGASRWRSPLGRLPPAPGYQDQQHGGAPRYVSPLQPQGIRTSSTAGPAAGSEQCVHRDTSVQ